MRSILIVFFVLVLIILILMFPFKIRLMSHINLISEKCFYCFKFWRIKLLCGKASVGLDGKIEIQNSNNLISGEFDKKYIKNLGKEILTKINVKKMEIFFTGGFTDDSYSSAIVCGTIMSVVQSMYSVLSQIYKDVKMYEDITPTFFETNLELTFDVVISISIIKILISILKSSKYKKINEEMSYEG